MKWIPSAILLTLVIVACLLPSEAPAAAVDDASFRAFLPHFEEATSRFVDGDASLWKQYASHANDATIMAGWAPMRRVGVKSALATTGQPRVLKTAEPS
jgi:hypothetical protein